jgi:hypothetical protein
VPAGLGDLSASLRAIAGFLEIDKDLMTVAAETSPPLEEHTNDGLAEWITALPAAEKDTLLRMVADGEGARVQALLLRRFRGGNTGTTGRSGSVRTATGLRAAAESRAAERTKAQEQRRREEQARKAAARAAAYAKRLDELAAEGEAPWKQIDEMIATKKTSEYDRAVALLHDLRALAKRQGEEAAFANRVLDLRAQYPGRQAWPAGSLQRSRVAPAIAPCWTTLEEDERLNSSRSRPGYRAAARGGRRYIRCRRGAELGGVHGSHGTGTAGQAA